MGEILNLTPLSLQDDMKVMSIKIKSDPESREKRITIKFGIVNFYITLNRNQYQHLLESLVSGGEVGCKAEMHCPIIKVGSKYIEIKEEMFNTQEKFWFEDEI